MKNLLQVVFITLIACITFSSCAEKMSIAKRRYNKGYYIARSGKKSDVSKTDKETGAHKDKVASQHRPEADRQYATATNQDELIAEAAAEQATRMSHDQVARHKEQIDKKNKFVYKAFEKGMKRLEKIERITTGNKKISSQIKTKLNPSGDRASDVLSLFWVVILILLLIYLVALLFDSFGLGWFVHIILLVALIFLILWLLHVV